MNEVAKSMWDIAIQFLEASAENHDRDVNLSICQTGIAECALKAAQFALNNPQLVVGDDGVPMPPGVVNPVIPQGPPGGPKVWGST